MGELSGWRTYRDLRVTVIVVLALPLDQEPSATRNTAPRSHINPTPRRPTAHQPPRIREALATALPLVVRGARDTEAFTHLHNAYGITPVRIMNPTHERTVQRTSRPASDVPEISKTSC